jgi:hypothetical protein
LKQYWRACVAAFAGCAILLLNACGGGSGSGAQASSPAAPSIAGFYSTPSGSFAGAGFVLVDATGYMIGSLRHGDSQSSGSIDFSGIAAVRYDGSWSIDAASLGYTATTYPSDSPAVTGTASSAVMGNVVQGSSISVVISEAPQAAGISSLSGIVSTAPVAGGASLAQLGGLYKNNPAGSGLVIDASTGQISGIYANNCNIAGTVAVNDAGGSVYTVTATLAGAGCPGVSGASHKFLAFLDSKRLLSLGTFINGTAYLTSFPRNTDPDAAGIPDGSYSPLPGFTEPPLPDMSAIAVEYGGGVSGAEASSAAPNLAMSIDASGRFYAQITSNTNSGTPYSENVFLGTLAINANQWTSSRVTVLYRDAATTTFSSGTVDLTATLGPEKDAAGNFKVHVNFAGATVPLVANNFLASPGRPAGYTSPPYTLPNGSYFNWGALSIDGITGRVQGFAAVGCEIEGVVGVTDASRNQFRLRATFSGAGCKAAALPEAAGEFLGYFYVGPNYISGQGYVFYGIVNGQRVNLFINSQQT